MCIVQAQTFSRLASWLARSLWAKRVQLSGASEWLAVKRFEQIVVREAGLGGFFFESLQGAAVFLCVEGELSVAIAVEPLLPEPGYPRGVITHADENRREKQNVWRFGLFRAHPEGYDTEFERSGTTRSRERVSPKRSAMK